MADSCQTYIYPYLCRIFPELLAHSHNVVGILICTTLEDIQWSLFDVFRFSFLVGGLLNILQSIFLGLS